MAPTTRVRYDDAFTPFLAWANMYHPFPLTSYEELDDLLVMFFEHMFDENPARGARQKCVNLRSAVILKWPRSKHVLLASAKALTGWSNEVPPQQRPPCPYPLALLLVNSYQKERNLQMATLSLLAFDCFLRISEVLGITRADITLPSPVHPGAIRLPHTKTGENQSVLLRHPTATALLRLLLSTVPTSPSSKIFTLTPQQVNGHLKRVVQLLNINVHITAHSFRHGGASHDLIKGIKLEDIMSRGRWAACRSVEHYLQAGRALSLTVSIPEPSASIATRLQLHPDLVLLGI